MHGAGHDGFDPVNAALQAKSQELLNRGVNSLTLDELGFLMAHLQRRDVTSMKDALVLFTNTCPLFQGASSASNGNKDLKARIEIVWNASRLPITGAGILAIAQLLIEALK